MTSAFVTGLPWPLQARLRHGCGRGVGLSDLTDLCPFVRSRN